MKTKIVFAVLLTGIMFAGSCKKDDGNGGKKKIFGTVRFNDGVSAADDIAPGATVFISYGSKVATGTIDQTVTCDARGEYTIKGLKKGDYFVSGEYITSHGFKYTTKGYGVTLESTKNELELNIRMQ